MVLLHDYRATVRRFCMLSSHRRVHNKLSRCCTIRNVKYESLWDNLGMSDIIVNIHVFNYARAHASFYISRLTSTNWTLTTRNLYLYTDNELLPCQLLVNHCNFYKQVQPFLDCLFTLQLLHFVRLNFSELFVLLAGLPAPTRVTFSYSFCFGTVTPSLAKVHGPIAHRNFTQHFQAFSYWTVWDNFSIIRRPSNGR